MIISLFSFWSLFSDNNFKPISFYLCSQKYYCQETTEINVKERWFWRQFFIAAISTLLKILLNPQVCLCQKNIERRKEYVLTLSELPNVKIVHFTMSCNLNLCRRKYFSSKRPAKFSEKSPCWITKPGFSSHWRRPNVHKSWQQVVFNKMTFIVGATDTWKGWQS